MLTTVMASVWTFFSLTRLSGIVTDTVQQSESVTAVTSRLAGALEREDDAVLLILAGDVRGTQVLATERAVVDKARRGSLRRPRGRTTSASWRAPLQAELQAYRQAADGVIAVAVEREALVQYHQTGEPRAAPRRRADDRDPRSALRTGASRRSPVPAMRPPARVAPCC